MANGTIAFDTLQTSGQITGTAKSLDTDYVVNGSAKAWCRWSLSDQSAAIGSFNIGSITDSGTGVGTLNLSNNFLANDTAQFMASSNYHAWNDQAGSTSTIVLASGNSSHTKADVSRAFAGAFGDLA